MFKSPGVLRNLHNLSRSSHIIKQNFAVRNFSHFNLNARTTPVLSFDTNRFANNGIRFESTSSASSDFLEKIPEPPAIPEETYQAVFDKVVEAAPALVEGAEPAFATIGLGGWSPVGMVQNCMEFCHVTCDIPWWGTILIGTICVRVILFPLVVLAQRNGAKLANNMPQLQVLQAKMTEARQSGNAIESARYSQAMMIFMKEKNVNPLKNMIVPLAQAPLFLSFFIGLRQMANAPVASMSEGGLWWFTDLTVADPFYLLPIITSITMLATIEVGTDSARLQHQNMQTMKYVLRALPFVILPFTINFPGAIVCYWTFSNLISLAQVAFLRTPKVRAYFNIEKVVEPAKGAAVVKKKGFVAGVKDSYTNMKITRELEERRRIDEIMFQRAAKGAIQKTYKYDPTKATTAIEAKKR